MSVYTDRSHSQKYKYVIIVAESKRNDNFLCVFINTDQSKNTFIAQYQPCFEPNDDRPYLDHKSYIDCYDPKEFLASEIEASIANNKKNHRGKATETDLDLIRDLIKECPQIVEALKKAYF